ncbi:MAG: hypothetical protein HS126_18875 [Anaerolineales bacterium]|nr:hypothetical protein [Anaerolineales bacterium]
MNQFCNSTWVTRFARWREEFVEAIGGSAIDLIGLLATLLPYLLVVSLLYSYIFDKIITDWVIRLAAALVSGAVIEFYAIAVMTLEQRVNLFNAGLDRYNSSRVYYNARQAKLNYLLLILLIALFGHIVPMIKGEGYEWMSVLALLPMVLISWFSYEVFTTNLALKERIRNKEKKDEDEHLARTTRDFAERGKLEAEADLLREKRLLEEAVAKQKQAEARIAREERLKTEVKPVTVSLRKDYEAPQNGAAKPWDERSFAEINAALEAGEEPPAIHHLQTYQRYVKLCENLDLGMEFDIRACELVGVNQVRFRKDLKLLAAHRLVQEVSRGVYVLLAPYEIR